MSEHTCSADARGTRRGYKQGCRAQTCRAANAEYYRDRRAASVSVTGQPRETGGARSNVTPLRSTSKAKTRSVTERRATDIATEPGRVEKGVLAELDELKAPAGQREIAITCARLLDNPDRWSQHPQTTRQLMGILSELREKNAPKRKSGRLAAVQKMTSRGA